MLRHLAVDALALWGFAELATRAGRAAVHFWLYRGISKARCPCHQFPPAILRGGHG